MPPAPIYVKKTVSKSQPENYVPFLKTLNPKQAEAVTFGEGPLLILAGAGSGKTKVLTSRIAYLILKMGISPEGILAVTFTNKAAGEMRERLQNLAGEKASKVWLGTFHSLGLRMLRRESKALGLKNDLIVYGDDDQLSLVKQVMAELNISEKSFAPKAVLARINQAKNDNIGPAEFANRAHDFLSERVAKIYSAYQRKLREMGCLDYGDLICEPINMLRQSAHILQNYQERFQYVLVDEYQDTNKAQYILTGLLSAASKNLLAVGDPDQSIYAWRGADISNILDFERDYPDATVLRLEQNYRSTSNILSAANSVIERNRKRLKKTLWTENPSGNKLVFEEARDEYHEAELVIERIRELSGPGGGMGFKDMAVFYRTNAQSRVFEEKLMREGIPYRVIGGVRFYDRQEIRDALAYLRIIANPNDIISLRRVINTPPRGVGEVTFEKINSLSKEKKIPLFEAFRSALDSGLLAKTKVKDFIEACDDFRIDTGRVSLHELALRLLEDSGYMQMWQKEASEEAMERVENLSEFISAIKDFETVNIGATLSDFLDQVALISDLDNYEEKADRITLMTLHSAKGLEFKAVFLAGMEEGIFPHSRSMEDANGLEEERRLCYVGMTRAMEELYLYAAGERKVFGESRYQTRSRFIDEISPEYIIFKTAEKAAPKTFYAPDEVYYTTDGSQEEGYREDYRGRPQPSATGRGRSNGSYRQYGSAGKSGAYKAGHADTAVHYNHTTEEEFEPQPWRVGMKVSHPSFGTGVIRERSGTGEDTKLTIRFDVGVKKLVVKYASLTPLG